MSITRTKIFMASSGERASKEKKWEWEHYLQIISQRPKQKNATSLKIDRF